ncbi:MAG: fatty acyl-AMP ligase [Pseudomonadales bacterium]
MNWTLDPLKLQALVPADPGADEPAIDITARTLHEALDQSARGQSGSRGLTFFDGRGRESRFLAYRELRSEARRVAKQLLGLGAHAGDRIAVIAETSPDFVVLFFACQYANLVPVPLTANVTLGGRDRYVEQIAFFIRKVGAVAAFSTTDFGELLSDAVSRAGSSLLFAGTLDELAIHAADAEVTQLLGTATPRDCAYIQFTSGSTRVARGAIIEQQAIMANLQAMVGPGLRLTRNDRLLSWLPFYHDMGLVGKLLVPVAAGLSAGFLGTREFALRPRLWLTLLDRTQATVSFSPPFGYELCARRGLGRDRDAERLDLSHWRVAGVGADMIRPEVLREFAQAMAPHGFRGTALVPAYGMAEVGLAISFADVSRDFEVDYVHRDRCMNDGIASPPTEADYRGGARASDFKGFVVCGRPVENTSVEIRAENGAPLPERHIGTIWVRTPSCMNGYFDEPEANAAALQDGWLNTGDLGYFAEGRLVITGRAKDLIIANGRNLWPQDLEAIAEANKAVRPGDAMAFCVQTPGEKDEVVLLLQCRLQDAAEADALRNRVRCNVQTSLGVPVTVCLVPPHSLPRTSSGKPARAQARLMYLAARQAEASAANGSQSPEAAAIRVEPLCIA